MNSFKILLISTVALLSTGFAWAESQPKPEALPAGQHMYVIEREMPGVGQLSAADLKGASQKSCGVLRNLGPEIQWIQSYVTGDKLYCVYLAPSEEMVREHAKLGGFPANKISEVKTIISPATATAEIGK